MSAKVTWVAMAAALAAAANVDKITLTTLNSTENGYMVQILYPNGSLVDLTKMASSKMFSLPNNWTIQHIEYFPRSSPFISLVDVGVETLNKELAYDHLGAMIVTLNLDLSRNKITSIDQVHFPRRMTQINLTSNLLQRIGALNPPAKEDDSGSPLSRIYIDNNNISTLQDATFPQGTQFISLRANALTSVDAKQWPLALKELYLDKNLITSVDTTFPQSLNILSLTQNKLKIFNANSLPSNITNLCLAGNPLDTIYATPAQFEILARVSNPNKTKFAKDPSACDSVFSANLSFAACPDSYRLLWDLFPICMVTPRPPSGASGLSTKTFFAIVSIAVLICGILILICIRKHRKRKTLDEDVFSWNYSQSKSSTGLADSSLIGNDIRFDPYFQKLRIPVNDLEVIKLVATGGFGMVFLGKLTDKSGKIDVAIKQLLPDKVQQVQTVEIFMEEIRLCAFLHHPNIVRFIGIAYTSLHNLSVVTEYMPRGDLWSWLEKDPRQFSWQGGQVGGRNTVSKLHIAKDVVSAFSFLHAMTPIVLHRDLKAKNVLLGENWEAKLTDFGTSRPYEEDLTMTAEIGTLPWMAPEVIKGERYNEKADIYSIGVLLAELDTCVVPYSNILYEMGPNQDIQMARLRIGTMVTSGQIKPKFSRECPASILEIARQCLSHAPQSRPSAMKIHKTLELIGNSVPSI